MRDSMRKKANNIMRSDFRDNRDTRIISTSSNIGNRGKESVIKNVAE